MFRDYLAIHHSVLKVKNGPGSKSKNLVKRRLLTTSTSQKNKEVITIEGNDGGRVDGESRMKEDEERVHDGFMVI